MIKKSYLIYLDILGFENLAQIMSEEKGIESRKIRMDFINVIKEKVGSIEEKGRIIGKHYGKKDDWILVAETIDNVFSVIYDLLNHNTGYKGYERIPLEIAVGRGEFDNWARFEGEKLIVENETIEFLKSYIIDYYRKWYKENNEGRKIKSTFLIFTNTAFKELEPLDKAECKQISYKDNKMEVAFFASNVDKVGQRGKAFEFLEKIEYVGNKWYGRIDTLYVPPLEYEDIAKTLKEEKIVFITGTQEYGKTYTAVRFLWEYWNNGYEPRWIKGGEPTERVEVRKKLENIKAELKPRCIIYFEDPFGKTKYEKREGLEREIGIIIDTVRTVEDTFVIMTSREEVFKEFEKEKLSEKELKQFEMKLNIKNPSYNYEKRKEILLKLAEEECCKWFKNEKLKGLVLGAIKDERILSTPLSIKDFIVATVDTNEQFALKEKIKLKSKETSKVFANDIKNMSDDKILFLSFLFISSYFKIDFVRLNYQELVRELNLVDAWDFDRVLNWFKDDKISITDKYIQFSHSSYSEALEYLIVEDGYITRIGKAIFGKLLLNITKKAENAGIVARFVESNFCKLPMDVRNELLINLSEYNEAIGYVAKVIESNFDKVPEDLRNKLLFLVQYKASDTVANILEYNFDKLSINVRNDLLLNFSKKDHAVWSVADTVTSNFEKFPTCVRNELLLNLSTKYWAVLSVANTVASNFDKVSPDVKNLLFTLCKKDNAVSEVAQAVASNFTKLPEDVRNELLLELSENYRAAENIAMVVTANFDLLSKELISKLLFKLSEYDETVRSVPKIIAANFDKLPENVRTELLFELSMNKKTYSTAAKIIASNFDKFPEDVTNFLFKYYKRDSASVAVVSVITTNFDKLHDDAKLLLFKISERNDVAGNVTESVIYNFDKLPENVRNELLLKLSEKDQAVGAITKFITSNFDKLPDKIRNKLLLNLSVKKEALETVANIVVSNYDQLPENVRNLIFKLSESDNAVAVCTIVRNIAANFNKLPENVRNLLLTMSEKYEALTVAEAVAAHFDKLPENERNELLLKLSEKYSTSNTIANIVISYFDKLPDKIRNKLLYNLFEKGGEYHVVTERNRMPVPVIRLKDGKGVEYHAIESIATAIALNFDKLPETIRNYLFELSENEDGVWSVSRIIVANFDNVHDEVKKLLFELSEQEAGCEAVACAIGFRFDKLPENIRTELLLRLSEKDIATKVVAEVVESNFDKLAEDVRNQLLLKLSVRRNAAGIVARIVESNPKKVAKVVKNLSHKFQKQLWQVSEPTYSYTH